MADASKQSGFVVQLIRHVPVEVTGVSFTGKHTVTVDFKAGQWTFYAAGTKSPTGYFIVSA